MFTQKRTSHLKFFEMILFVTVFLISGFLTNTNIVLASNATNTILVSCAPGSGDLYNMGTGERCPSYTETKALIGCKDGSGDLYDMNTGKRCLNTLLVGCKDGSGDLYDVNTGRRCSNTPLATCLAGSGDKYDMNTGKKCTNDTTPVLKACAPLSGDLYDMFTGKLCATKGGVVIGSLTPKESLTNKDLTLLTPNGQLSGSMTGKDEETYGEVAGTSSENISGRQMLARSLYASVGKIGSIVTGPMSIWIILLIIAIILGGGYGIYELLKKKNKTGLKSGPINTKPTAPITPITNNTTVPETKTQSTAFVPPVTATAAPAQQQMNIPNVHK